MIGRMRVRRRRATLLILAFSGCALALVPMLLCCQTTAATAGPDPRCPHAAADGDACPLHQPGSEPGSSCPALRGCAPDGLLAALLSLTGAPPEPVLRTVVHLVAGPAITSPDEHPHRLGHPPDPPPPRG